MQKPGVAPAARPIADQLPAGRAADDDRVQRLAGLAEPPARCHAVRWARASRPWTARAHARPRERRLGRTAGSRQHRGQRDRRAARPRPAVALERGERHRLVERRRRRSASAAAPPGARRCPSRSPEVVRERADVEAGRAVDAQRHDDPSSTPSDLERGTSTASSRRRASAAAASAAHQPCRPALAPVAGEL